MDAQEAEQEIWKAVPGYETRYEVSSKGRVRSFVARGMSKCEPKILTLLRFPSGYDFVNLHKDGVQRTVKVSRLVATAFIPNPDNLPFVNHKDENKGNNAVENLEWCTAAYNANYGTRNERLSKTMLNAADRSTRVCQYTLDNILVAVYPSLMEATRATGVDRRGIESCCKGGRNKRASDGSMRYKPIFTAGGFKWKYA